MNAQKIMIFALVSVLLVSGCTGGGSTDTEFSETDGLVITEFSISPSDTTDYYKDYEDHQAVSLTMDFENAGGKTIDKKQIKAYIFGPAMKAKAFGKLTTELGMNLEHDLRKVWTVTTSGDEDKYELLDENAGDVSKNDNDVFAVLKYNDEDSDEKFFSPDKDAGISGSIGSLYLEMVPPDLDEGLSSPFTFHARVCYPYTTSTITTLTKSTREEFEAEEARKSEAETRNSAGPIQIKMISKENVRIRGSNLPIEFEITNVGGGFATTGKLDDKKMVCADDPRIRATDRDKIKFEANSDVGELQCAKTVNMDNNMATVRCTITGLKGDVPTQEIHVTAKAEYTYFVDGETSVNVKDDIDDLDGADDDE